MSMEESAPSRENSPQEGFEAKEETFGSFWGSFWAPAWSG